VQIESVCGLDAVEEIAAVDGIDALVVGCSDLSFALGTPLNPFSAAMIAAIRRVQEAASQAHIASGIAVSAEPKAIARLANGKSSLVVYSADVRIYSQAMDGAADAIRKEWQPQTGSPTEEETVKQEGRS
jgi:2-keto-3-deoxy-L-rhamnonate aldolase RhmA